MTGTNSNHVTAEDRSGQNDGLPTDLTRYDVTLAAIPLLFAVACFAAVLFEVAVPTALAAASTIGLGLIFDITYRNPPGPTR